VKKMTGRSSLPIGAPELAIDLGAIRANWRTFDELTNAKTAAVVKANAYGAGTAEAARALEKVGCGIFFVATPGEGAVLRAVLPDTAIYVLGGFTAGSKEEFYENDLIPVLNDLGQVDRWATLDVRRGSRPAAVHIDTGMSRLGIHHREVRDLAASVTREGIQLTLVVSHLACADQPAHPLNSVQLERFSEALRFFPGVEASLSASAGVLLGPDYHFDVVRPGVGLFGGNPMPSRSAFLEHVVSVRAPILQLRCVELGDTVGYGAGYQATRTRRLATVGVGYADGFPRTLGNRGIALVDGVPAPYVGTVSMDSIILDLTGIDSVGGEAEMLGPGVTVDTLADLAGTIPNEILTGLGGRLVRRYVDEDLAGEKVFA
jgi:alanine racemase